MEFSGRLTSFPPADLLQWAAQVRSTGSLVVRRSSREKRVYFGKGLVTGCLSDDPAEHYGQHLLLHGELEERALVKALSHCMRTGQQLGVALVELGLLSAEKVRETLRQRDMDAVCDLFLWQRGVFYFENEPLPEAELAPEPLGVMEVVLEGTRWIDELGRIRKVFVHDNVILRRSNRALPAEATPLERRIFEAVEDSRSLGELYRWTRGSYFRYLEAAYRLCLSEVLDIQQVGEVGPAETTEMHLADLLLEQAGEEERDLLSRRRLGLPLDLLRRLHPAWVDPPSAEERKELSPEMADFAAGIDRGASLGELLAGDLELESRQLDFLQLELHRRRLALLPVTPEDLERRATRGGETGRGSWWRRILQTPG